jgi:hypothetical protein
MQQIVKMTSINLFYFLCIYQTKSFATEYAKDSIDDITVDLLDTLCSQIICHRVYMHQIVKMTSLSISSIFFAC